MHECVRGYVRACVCAWLRACVCALRTHECAISKSSKFVACINNVVKVNDKAVDLYLSHVYKLINRLYMPV